MKFPFLGGEKKNKKKIIIEFGRLSKCKEIHFFIHLFDVWLVESFYANEENKKLWQQNGEER